MPSLASSRTVLARVRAVRAREWHDLLRAQLALGWARLLVRTRPRGQLMSASSEAPVRRPLPATRRRATTLAWAVDRVAELGMVRATCLVRAIALQELLRREGIDDVHLRLGVNRGATGLEAHAWVELGGVPLGTAGRERSRFVPMTAAASPRR